MGNMAVFAGGAEGRAGGTSGKKKPEEWLETFQLFKVLPINPVKARRDSGETLGMAKNE